MTGRVEMFDLECVYEDQDKEDPRIHRSFEANDCGGYTVTVLMPPTREPTYEEQFTVFIDFLGFSEVSRETDDTTRLKILNLLQALSALRGEFDVQSTAEEGRKTTLIKPAITTFSDHIVISYPVQRICNEIGPDELMPTIFMQTQIVQLLGRIAAEALSIGFLVRGGATIGKLYHGRGVVFGKALVDAFEIESRTSIYPRVVLSPQITCRSTWIQNQVGILRGDDGLYHLDYFKELLFSAAPVGDRFRSTVKEWFSDVTGLIARNLADLEGRGSLNELAKWAWFAREFRSGLERLPSQLLVDLGVSLDQIHSTNT
jgi:hypothetical protein